jgi:nicotinate phosphoribosyltransferase
MTECNDQPVAKLSDTPEKGMCLDKGYVEYITKVFKDKVRKAKETK